MLSDSIVDKVEEDQGAAHGQTMLKGAIPDSTTIWSVCPEVDPEHAGVITSARVNTQGPPQGEVEVAVENNLKTRQRLCHGRKANHCSG